MDFAAARSGGQSVADLNRGSWILVPGVDTFEHPGIATSYVGRSIRLRDGEVCQILGGGIGFDRFEKLLHSAKGTVHT